ncbi:seryl-trna synthetase [Holotrichia oblita]|uniref:Seryl-trna synthetase n=1 Tax=Holotrichia oblita TaxID=644536 RepID=A0ACB9SX22_HOLOL|nr:seryl-trna synthetase [Holotrichia oblita]
MRKIISFLLNKPSFYSISSRLWHVQHSPELDFTYICNQNNLEDITANIRRRKGVGDIKLVQQLKRDLDDLNPTDPKYEGAKLKFLSECKNIPNTTHPDIIDYNDEPKIIKHIGEKKEFKFKPKEFHEISKRLNLIRTEQLGYLSGHRSYYLLGDLANLEHALTRYTLNNLIQQNFKLITVPDILHRDIIESCGLNTRGERTQVYQLDERHGSDLCLSGTSEMALAGFLMNRILSEEKELPLKLATVSRCFRAETSSIADEKGIYRVHEFTKVEIFIVTKPEESDNMLEEIRNIEEEHFAMLGIHLRTLDMPPHELGAPAYRKYDIEAWMPGRQIFGEISSCSNCTDYQSRRLNIKYSKVGGGGTEFVHTLNGTACAVPRMLIALLETYQNDNGTISVPDCLRRYLGNKDVIRRQKNVPELMLIKNKK